MGETVSFLLGRFLLRKWVAELTADWPMWAALNAALREDGWKLVLLLRMSPAMPFSVINYALGSSSLPVSVQLPVQLPVHECTQHTAELLLLTSDGSWKGGLTDMLLD